jgi:hypothetical protein
MHVERDGNQPLAFGHGRVRVFDSVDEASPASRDSFARLVPRLCKAATMSAGCQSFLAISVTFVVDYESQMYASTFFM